MRTCPGAAPYLCGVLRSVAVATYAGGEEISVTFIAVGR
jgi:hypothetical protein